MNDDASEISKTLMRTPKCLDNGPRSSRSLYYKYIMPPPARPPLKVVLKDLFGYGHTIFGPNDAIIFLDFPPSHNELEK